MITVQMLPTYCAGDCCGVADDDGVGRDDGDADS